MARAQKATDAIGQSKLQIGNLNFGVGLTTQLAHGLNDFGHAATVGRVVVAQTAPIGVDRQPALARNELAIGHKFSALPFGTKTQILKLHQHRDGEAVVDRCIANVCGANAGLFKSPGGCPGCRRMD